MKSLRVRIAALEKASRQVSPSQQLDYFIHALRGDEAALERLRQLRREGIINGRLDELADAILIPLRAQGAGDSDNEVA